MPIRDIKIVLFISYVLAYPLAVAGPIFVDPLLKSHVLYSARTYPYAHYCVLIYVFLLAFSAVMLGLAKTTRWLYGSVGLFLFSMTISLPIFRPELPHGNLFSVGVGTAFFSAFAIFVWSVGSKIAVDASSLTTAGQQTLEYIKSVFAFVRQGAFAGVALFGALFFAAYSTGFNYVESTVSDKNEVLLLKANVAVQIAFYGMYALSGPLRYFFSMTIKILDQFKEIASRLDRQNADAVPQKS